MDKKRGLKYGVVFVCILGVFFWHGCTKEQVEQIEEALANFATLRLSPACAVINRGQSQTYTVTKLDADGNDLGTVPADDVTWSSTDTTVAAYASGGKMNGNGGGNAEITASYSGKTAEALISVNPRSSAHNCREYEWYRSQMDSGYASNNNCGPTSTHMAIKWYKDGQGNTPTVEQIRDRYPRNGGWWYTSDIQNTLNYYNIPYATHSINSVNDLMKYIKRGNLLLLCVEMKWVRYNRHQFYDRFYSFDSGHFLIVKGYSKDEKYFIVYDPNSWGSDYYGDGTMMGRNRYYKVEDLLNAVKKWWSYAIEVGPGVSSTFDPERLPLGNAGPREYLMEYTDIEN